MAENFRPNNTRWNAANNYDNHSDDPPSSSPADWTQNILSSSTEIAESSFLYEDLSTRPFFFSSSSSGPANLRQPFLLFNEQTVDCRSPEFDLRGVCREMQRGEGNETLKKFEVFGLESQFGRNQVQFADNISSSCGFYPSSFPPVGTMFFEVGPSSNSIFDKSSEEPREISHDESALKKPRIATLTTMPDFKSLQMKKEKIGDRISALQQLVSPFGKTDRASVLHEAIEYIKFLHDQVSVLSTPYLKKGHHKKEHKKSGRTNNEEPRQELSSRGLCLVPISNTYPIADLWAPNFGRTYM